VKKYILINQVTGPLFIDIANAFNKTGIPTELYTGQIESTYAVVDDEVSIKYLKNYDKSTMIKRMLSWVLFTIQIFFRLLFKKGKQTKSLYVTNPPFSPFIGLIPRCFSEF